MLAMASASSRVASLERTIVLSLLRREVHGHRQRGAPPVRKPTRAALVLLDQNPPRQPVFPRVAGLAGTPAEMLARYADRHLGISAEVLYPVRALAASREHVEGTRLRHETKPDLDLVRPASHTPRSRQVAEVLVRERIEIDRGHQPTGPCREQPSRGKQFPEA